MGNGEGNRIKKKEKFLKASTGLLAKKKENGKGEALGEKKSKGQNSEGGGPRHMWKKEKIKRKISEKFSPNKKERNAPWRLDAGGGKWGKADGKA